MIDIRDFGNNSLFAIKAHDTSVRMRAKVAVLGAFTTNGRRPGFRVNFLSTEGVGGTAQVIRFENREDAQRWINSVGQNYYAPDDMDIMNNRAGEYVRVPLADFDTDAWVNSILIRRLSDRTRALINTHCPQYLSEEPDEEVPQRSSYRGFSF